MAKVEIAKTFYSEIENKFKAESVEVFLHLKSLEGNPKKGKPLGKVGGIVIKELKYKGFRFYFLGDGYKLKFLSVDELTDLLLKFVRMSDKKSQQKVIEEIKNVLRLIGPGGF